MPKHNVDYSKTQIYKLIHKDDHNDENIYIGNTTHFVNRKCKHKTCCNNILDKAYNQKKYKYIRENGGWEEWEMKWIEDYPCNNKLEADAREEYWRRLFNAQLNMNKASITKEELIIEKNNRSNEWYKYNKEKKAEYAKQYRLNNPEKYKAQVKSYYEKSKIKNIDI